MGKILDFARAVAIGVFAAAVSGGGAQALLISPTFDSSLTGSANAAGFEAAIGTAISTMDGLYSTPGTVQILFKFDGSGATHGSSQTTTYTFGYSTYKSLLLADSAAHPQNLILATAVANLS